MLKRKELREKLNVITIREIDTFINDVLEQREAMVDIDNEEDMNTAQADLKDYLADVLYNWFA